MGLNSNDQVVQKIYFIKKGQQVILSLTSSFSLLPNMDCVTVQTTKSQALQP